MVVTAADAKKLATCEAPGRLNMLEWDEKPVMVAEVEVLLQFRTRVIASLSSFLARESAYSVGSKSQSRGGVLCRFLRVPRPQRTVVLESIGRKPG